MDVRDQCLFLFAPWLMASFKHCHDFVMFFAEAFYFFIEL